MPTNPEVPAAPARRTAPMWLATGLCVLLAGCGSGGSTGEPAIAPTTSARLTAQDLAGKPVDPFRDDNRKATVVIFVANDCPISNRYAPEIRRLYETFHPQGVVFWLVHPNADETPEAIRKHAAEYRYPMEVIRDPGHALVRRAQVHVTPEAAVFLPDGKLVYHGRIDDRYVDFGKDRLEPTKRDLQEVIDAIIKGEPVTPSSTRAIGCYIADEP